MAHPQSTRHHDLLTWVILAAIALAVAIYVTFFMPKAAGGPIGKLHPDVGRPLGTLTLEPLTGAARPVTNDDLAGKVVLIDFWGPDCPPCKRELPELIAVAEQFKNRPDFLFVPVSCPMGDGKIASLQADTEMFLSHIRSTAATYQLPEEVWKQMDLFSESGDPRIRAALGDMYLDSMPATVVIDRQGVIRGKWEGYHEGYERQVADLLAELLGNEKL